MLWKGNYPSARSDIEIMRMNGSTDDSKHVDKSPEAGNTWIEDIFRELVTLHNAQECVNGDCEDENAACQVTSRHEPSLRPTLRRSYENRIAAKSNGIEEKGGGLLDIGKEEVVYQHKKLVCGDLRPRFQPP